MGSSNHPPKDELVDKLVRSISGLRPKTTGPICDSCSRAFSIEGEDTAYVFADWTHDGWVLTRTHCQECGIGLEDRQHVEAVVDCEIGRRQNGEFHPLYNPDVVQLNTSDGAVMRE